MSEEINEVLELVKDAQGKGKFNLADVIKGRGFPEDTIEVYVDVASAYELTKLNERLILVTDDEESIVLEKEAKALSDKILASKLTFHMRGVSQGLAEAIENKSKVNKSKDEDAFILEYFARLIASNIVKIVDAEGNEDERVFELADIEELRAGLPIEAWEQLVSTTQKLTLASGYFKGLTDAGFLQKS
jgi:hypothetical protein